MVVDESAVKTVFAVPVSSAAFAAEARLTTPTAAKPIVHLLNFIGSSSLVYFFAHVTYAQTWGKNSLPRHQPVHLPELIRKTRRFDNKFFSPGFSPDPTQ